MDRDWVCVCELSIFAGVSGFGQYKREPMDSAGYSNEINLCCRIVRGEYVPLTAITVPKAEEISNFSWANNF
jgi:hypothetical protein